MDHGKAKKKAESIVSKMTAYEKISQLLYTSPAIPRLGISEYNWWNEAAHGVARAGTATVFPQAIGLAAAFDPELIRKVGDAVSDEARAKYNKSVSLGDRGIYKGLTFWAPNINIFRDGRWGRGQETFGEDPYLTSVCAVSYIKGIQGDGDYLKAAACAKHFAVHSGPEHARHGFDARASLKDMWETYLPAFEKAVGAGVAGVMGAYNRTNGEPCCAHSYLMEDVLYGRFGFKGYFVSDCGAINDICDGHHYTETPEEAAALALKKGCHLNCGKTYEKLIDAYEHDLITDEDITKAATRLYTVRTLLGEFEEERPFSGIPYSVVGCEKHRELNLRAARESLVLLQNRDGFLPLKKKPRRIAVIGPHAHSVVVLEGNYNGTSSEYVTVADGIRRVFPDAGVTVEAGSRIVSPCGYEGENLLFPAVAAASEADLTVLCLGLDRTAEGEEMPFGAEGFDRGDRTTVALPSAQKALGEAVCGVCENVVLLTFGGGPTDVGEKLRSSVRALIHCFYPGALGGLAAAELIRGDYSPSGRLPVTFPYADAPVPDIKDYSMRGRTYRFSREKPLYPYGYGLSYTTFSYKDAEIRAYDGDTVTVSVNVTNTGGCDGYETVQIYAHFDDSRTETPVYQLCGVAKPFIKAKETVNVSVTVDKYWLKAVLGDGERVTPDGKITLYAGGHQPDTVSRALCGECIGITPSDGEVFK